MKSITPRLITGMSVLSVVVALISLPAVPVNAESIQHLSIIQPGGMPGWPVMMGVTRLTNGLNVTWDGPSGYYQLFQKHLLTDPAWQPVGPATNLARQAAVAPLSGSGFFRVAGPAPAYAGSNACAECHVATVSTVIQTPHARAFQTLVQVGQATNSACLACHTVGSGLPTGFSSASATPQLQGVQCENCHGPAANHAAVYFDPTVRPQVELAGTMCGGCHNNQFPPAQVASFHPPVYEEWKASAHSSVLPELQADFAGSPGLISTCGRCHSGSVRESFLEGEPLPTAQEASAIGITCATCHDPHEQFTYTNILSGVITNPVTGQVRTNGPAGSTYTNQVRNPLSSLQDYHVTGDFTTNYNPNINICAQCHNDRGASYRDTSRPPHNSPQYNLLIGTTGVLDTNNPSLPHFEPASHALFITNQCVGCHMQTAPSSGPGHPPDAGHEFVVNRYDMCAECHVSGVNASNLVVLVTTSFTNQIQGVQSLLVQWATNKAPAILGTTSYGVNAWEYTNPGELSPPTPGPTSAQQALIPVNIKIARFNLYLVYHDASYGVHNALYSQSLLTTAGDAVRTELRN
jgi:hypothetical protein